MSHRLASLLLCCGLLGCYRPQYRGPYSCDAARGASDCPPGFACVGQKCVSASVPTSEGCSGEGALLVMARAGRVFACRGSFAPGELASLCSHSPGIHLCGSDPRDDELLPLIDCASQSGFLAVAAPLAVQNGVGGAGVDAICNPAPGSGERAILGCGTPAEAISLNAPGCHSLTHALRCPQSGAWACRDGLGDLAHDAALDAVGGALCCSGAMPR